MDVSAIRERRTCPRFPIEQEVRYKQLSAQAVLAGVGKTLNMSSKGILFTTEQRLSTGAPVILEVSWPVLLDGRIALKLVVRGRTVWCDEAKGAIEFRSYQFRTQGTEGLNHFAASNHTPEKPIVKVLEANQEWSGRRRGGR